MNTKLILTAGVVLLFAQVRLLAEAGDDNPTGVAGFFNGDIATGCSYDANTGNARRTVDDLVVPGAIGTYPLKWSRYFNSHVTFNNNITGGNWRFSYRDYSFDTSVYSYGAVFMPDGRAIPMDFRYGVEEWVEQPTGTHNTILHMSDGGQVVLNDQQHIGQVTYTTAPLPVQVIDPYGQITTITYAWYIGNNQVKWKLDKITEPGGRYLQINWDATNTLITSVQAFDGIANHAAIGSVTYTWSNFTLATGTVKVLSQVLYSDQTAATYTYTDQKYPGPCVCPLSLRQDWHAALLATADDPRYQGAMRQIAYKYQTSGNHTRILSENHLINGVAGEAVTTISGLGTDNNPTITATETRGDSPTRTITYYKSERTWNCPQCTLPEYEPPDPQPTDGKVQSYTDFKGHSANFAYETDTAKPSAGFITSATDANNNTTTYTRSTLSYAILRITHPGGSYIDQTYTDETHPYFLASRTDENHHRTDYTRDSNNRITRKDYPVPDPLRQDGSTAREYETFNYNNFGQTLMHRLKNGAYEYFEYDSRGLLTDKTNPTWNYYAYDANNLGNFPSAEPLTHYEYYTSADYSGVWTDRIKTQTDPRGIVTAFEYDRAYDGNNENSGLPSGNPVFGRGLVTRMSYPGDTHLNETPTYPSGTYQSFGFDKYGNKLWEENELRQRTTYTYDDYRRVLTIKNALNKVVTNTYTPTNGTNTSPYVHTTNSVYTTTTPTGIVTKNIYDPNFKKTSTTQAFGTSLAATTSFMYDVDSARGYTWNGSLVAIQDPKGNRTAYTYDTRNRKITEIDALNQTTQWFYDNVSNVTSIQRKDTTTETKHYDQMNRVIDDTVPQTTTINVTTAFVYYPGDAQYAGLMKQVTDADGHITTFTNYDPSGLKTLVTYPNGDTHAFTYDNDKNLMSRRTVNGTTQNFSYDTRNRKLAMWWADASPPALTFTAEWSSFLYEAAGRLSSAKNGSGGTIGQGTIYSTITRQYDAAGHLILDRQNVDSALGDKDVQYAYDDDGKDTRLYLTSAGYDYTFSYDAMGRFEKILPTGGSVSFQYKYDAASNEVERDNLVNSVNQIYTRDALNRMSERDVKLNTTVLSSETYGFDPMSRITSTLREDGKTDSFTYYLDGELWTGSYGNPNPTRTVTYNIDQMGNRTSVLDTGVTTTYTGVNPNNGDDTAAKLNQYYSVGGSVVGNGSEHEIASYQNINYGYVNDERLSSITSGGNTYDLKYDALGRCIKRTLSITGTVFYVYDGEKPIVEYNSVGGIVGKNLYGRRIDEILMRVDSSYGTYYFQDDHEGSVTHLTSSTGTILESYTYDVFGAPAINNGALTSSAFGNRFMFTGREYTSTFGIYEYRARAYHPGLGRFTGEDSKGFDAGDYNLFRYCHNDPEDITDPMGLVPMPLDPSLDPYIGQAVTNVYNAYNGQHWWSQTEWTAAVVQDNRTGQRWANPASTDNKKTSVTPQLQLKGQTNLVDVHIHTFSHVADDITGTQFSWRDVAFADLSGHRGVVYVPFKGNITQLFQPSTDPTVRGEFWGGQYFQWNSKTQQWARFSGGHTDLRDRVAPRELAKYKENFKNHRADLSASRSINNTGASIVEKTIPSPNSRLIGGTGESDANDSYWFGCENPFVPRPLP